MRNRLEFQDKADNLSHCQFLALFNPLIDIRCSFFRHKNAPLDNHIQRGKASQLFYKRRDFILNLQ